MIRALGSEIACGIICRKWENLRSKLYAYPHLFRAQSPKFLKLLIRHGVNLSWTSGAGNILCHAVDNYHLPMVKTLLEAGMDSNDGGASDSISPFNRILVPSNREDSVQRQMRQVIAELLLQHGANPNIPYPDNEYPIYKAVVSMDYFYCRMHSQGFKLLTSLCENLNVQSNRGKTALYHVMENDKPWHNYIKVLPYASVLIEAGADPIMQDSSGRTPFESFVAKSTFGIGNFARYANKRRYSDIYCQLHFCTHYALKLNRVDLLPAQAVYN
ncbi:uncharacterized protein BDZ99DRAFT_555419 [Mytilinidion resinicola]|uniref:Ankyrin n=1 Tax=Mytilinidion resinicola TaxID=574789 RepID=A0A6A6XZU6_9PEZI|nr:uncharacterized protein BDZ99DRAFT_555419 [Mytilinidion resinicola]KAF2801264.1 hypothetical protein BDZ99DRAFT_555419 [Mytilinidion resinicola]